MISKLQNRPGFLLRRAHQISVALFELNCKDLSLTPAQYGILYTIAQTSPVDQTALSRYLGFDKVTTLHVVRSLRSRGLVSRRQSTTDGRKFELELTTEGKKLLNAALPLATKTSAQLLLPLSPEQQETLLSLLNTICIELEDFARAPLTRS